MRGCLRVCMDEGVFARAQVQEHICVRVCLGMYSLVCVCVYVFVRIYYQYIIHCAIMIYRTSLCASLFGHAFTCVCVRLCVYIIHIFTF